MATTKNHKVFANAAAAETSGLDLAQDIGVPEYVNRSVSNGALSNVAFTVPASSPYKIKIPVPLPNTLTVTINSLARTVVDGSSPASGQVAIDRATGVLTCHSSDAGLVGAYSMTPHYHAIVGEDLTWLYARAQKLTTEVNNAAVLGAVRTIYVRTDGNDTTGNGAEERPYATISKAAAIINASASAAFLVVLSAGSHTVASPDPSYSGGLVTTVPLFSAGKRVVALGAGRGLTTLTITNAYTPPEGTENEAAGLINFAGLDSISVVATMTGPYDLKLGSDEFAPEFLACSFTFTTANTKDFYIGYHGGGGLVGEMRACTIASPSTRTLQVVAMDVHRLTATGSATVGGGNWIEGVQGGSINRATSLSATEYIGDVVHNCTTNNSLSLTARALADLNVRTSGSVGIASARHLTGFHIVAASGFIAQNWDSTAGTIRISNGFLDVAQSGQSVGLFNFTALGSSIGRVELDSVRLRYTGTFAEPSTGSVSVVHAYARAGGSWTLSLSNVTIDSTCIPLFVGHTDETKDTYRETQTLDVVARGCWFEMTHPAATGPEDRKAVQYNSRGTFTADGCVFIGTHTAATDGTFAQAAFSQSGQFLAASEGNNTVFRNCTFRVAHRSGSVTGGKSIIDRQGTNTSTVVHNCLLETVGANAATYAIAGTGGTLSLGTIDVAGTAPATGVVQHGSVTAYAARYTYGDLDVAGAASLVGMVDVGADLTVTGAGTINGVATLSGQVFAPGLSTGLSGDALYIANGSGGELFY